MHRLATQVLAVTTESVVRLLGTVRTTKGSVETVPGQAHRDELPGADEVAATRHVGDAGADLCREGIIVRRLSATVGSKATSGSDHSRSARASASAHTMLRAPKPASSLVVASGGTVG